MSSSAILGSARLVSVDVTMLSLECSIEIPWFFDFPTLWKTRNELANSVKQIRGLDVDENDPVCIARMHSFFGVPLGD